MKLLVLAQTPPPSHGQSLATLALLQQLRQRPDWEVHHVELRLSRDNRDVGRWRFGKLLTTLSAGFRTVGRMLRHGRMPLYYIPAPGKRGALYRDWMLMALCRPFTRGLILHWHAVGLGAWLREKATPPERWITALLLGGATLSIIQGESGRDDASALQAREVVIVPNGVPSAHPPANKTAFHDPLQVLFVGLGCAEKGLFDALAGVQAANAAGTACQLTAIGPFADALTEQRFARHAAVQSGQARHLGFVSVAERDRLLRASDVFCFPSYFPYEGQPAVLLEALAHDLPIIATRWRGIPDSLPAKFVHLVPIREPEAIATALATVRREGAPQGALAAHHHQHFTQEKHHERMEAALRSVQASRRA